MRYIDWVFNDVGGAKGLLLIIKNGLTNHENLPPPLNVTVDRNDEHVTDVQEHKMV